jgi:YHS domain-containing protein
MKMTNYFATLVLVAGLFAAPFTLLADDTKPEKKPDKKLVPDKLTTCPVSGEKLGDMGKPVVFEYKGQEVKLCCKGCKPDFDKDPAKYMKKIREADKAKSSDSKTNDSKSTDAKSKDAKN